MYQGFGDTGLQPACGRFDSDRLHQVVNYQRVMKQKGLIVTNG